MFRSAALFHSGLRRRHALAVAVAATLVVAPDAALAQTTTDPTAPVTSVTTSTTAPTGLKATVASGTVTLDWDDYPSDKLSYYAVRRGTQPNPSTGTWTRLASNYTTSTATDKPATGTYYYYVTSIDTSKVVSPRSTVVMVNTATPTATPTPAPVVGGTETAPAPTPTPVATDPIIAAAGDIACDPASSSYNGGSGTASSCRQKATSDLVYNRGFAKVLTLGDNQYESGTLSAFNKSYAPTWGRFKSITSPAVGNHEYRVSGAAGYFDYFNGSGVSTGRAGSRGKGYYSYNVGDWHLIALNSNCSYVSCAAGSAQESWLKADLAANTAKCTLAYWHHPRFSSGSHGNNTSVAPLYNALYAANADVVLTSHDHSYERFAPQNASGAADSARGIRQFVVGTGGKNAYSFGTTKSNSQVRNSGTFGVLEMTLRPTSYDWKFRPEAGRSFTDAGTTSCH